MPEEHKSKIGLVREVIETCLLAVLTAISLWMGSTLIEHGNLLAAHAVMLNDHSGRVLRIEEHGSMQLEGHQRENAKEITNLDKRVEKLEAAIDTLMPMSTKVDYLIEGQKRVERLLEEHTKGATP